ncbi:MAG: DNA polymerase, partial [Planctomycetes bacterium]|nr:DNA polymerase [Planctomycetota bacterium]
RVIVRLRDSKIIELIDAVWGNNSSTVCKLLQSSNVKIDNQDEFGKTALMTAAASCNLGIIDVLMGFNPNLEIKDQSGKTAVNWSIFMKHKEGLKYLIDSGSNIETTDKKNKTPIIQAARAGFIDIVHILIDAGANLEHQDDNKLTAFNYADKNSHTTVAELLSNLTEQRNTAKTVNFGVLYGQSAFGLSQSLGIPRKEAKAFIDNYFEINPKVAGLTKSILDECKEKGYVTTLAGRKRYLPEITSKNVMVRKGAERQAFNTVLQGTAADLIKMAMLNAAREIEEKKHPWVMLLQVHDELVFESPEAAAEGCAKFAIRVMSSAMTLKVPLDVEAGVGDNWLEAK